MNARERILAWESTISIGSKDDAAVLRGIDELLRDFIDAHERNAYPGHYTKLLERARALGYGDK